MLKNFFNKLKIVYLSIQNKLPILLGRIFTKPNLNKIIIIFIVGFISRIFINYMFNINIFSGYLYQISGIYYFIFAWVNLIIHDFLNYFYITMDVSSSSNSIPKLKSNTILKMESSGERSSNNSNDSHAAWLKRHEEEVRLIKEKREKTLRLREENKRLKREEGIRVDTKEGLESQRRWLLEKHTYSHLSYREWEKLIDAPRRVSETERNNQNSLPDNYSNLTLPPIVDNPMTSFINAHNRLNNHVITSQVMQPQASTSVSISSSSDYFNSYTNDNYNDNQGNSSDNKGK